MLGWAGYARMLLQSIPPEEPARPCSSSSLGPRGRTSSAVSLLGLFLGAPDSHPALGDRRLNVGDRWVGGSWVVCVPGHAR